MLRFLTRNYLKWSEAFTKIHPRYQNCPAECAEVEDEGRVSYNPNRRFKCDDCPVKELDDKFRSDTLEIWARVAGVKSEKYRFDEMLSILYKAIRFKDTPPERMTVHQNGIVAVYQRELSLHKATNDFEEMQRRKTERP